MKKLRIVIAILACVLAVQVATATTPETKKIEKEKSAILKKIHRIASKTKFTDYLKIGETELIVLRCTVNENNEVEVYKVIGFDEDLKKAVRRTMEKKQIKTSPALAGQELALKLSFVKFQK